MKIGMILDNQFTGDPRVENEVRSLTHAGLEVSVLCYSFGNKPLTEKFHGANIIRFKVNKRWIKKLKGLNNTVFNFFPIYWAQKIESFIQEEKITHLHVHDLWMMESAIRANKKFNLPIIADMHENFVFALGHYKYSTTFPGNILISQKKWAKDEIRWLNEADHIIVVIEEAKNRMIKLGIPEEKISVVANYVNINEFSKDKALLTKELSKDQKDRFVITYTGGFDKHRGLEIAIQAIPLLIDKIPNIKLQLVGGGSNEKELKELVSTLGIVKYVEFPGYQPHENLPSFVKASDACIIPHLKTEHTDNTIPHKLFQYMLMEKPVIASNCDPIKRIIEETEAGFVYEFDSPEEFSEVVLKVYFGNRNEIGHKGSNAVLNKYNWIHTSKNLINVYSNQ